MKKARNGGIYTGWVIDNNEQGNYNPVQVWIPSLSSASGYFTGQFKEFGDNIGDMKKKIVEQLKGVCGEQGWFYRTMPVAPAGEVHYNSSSGASSVHDGLYQYGKTSQYVDERKNTDGVKSTSPIRMQGESSSVRLGGVSQPDGRFRNFILSDYNGYQNMALTSAPKGNFTSIGVGTRVIVAFADSGATGYVLGQIPSDCAFGITDLRLDKLPKN